MTHKIIDVNHKPVITPAQERAIMKSFEDWEGGGTVITAPHREHLGGVQVPGVSCYHSWLQVETPPSTDPLSNRAWFEKNFEEKEFDTGHVCGTCGATCLKDAGVLWAYDATSQAFGYPPKTKSKKKEQTRGRR